MGFGAEKWEGRLGFANPHSLSWCPFPLEVYIVQLCVKWRGEKGGGTGRRELTHHDLWRAGALHDFLQPVQVRPQRVRIARPKDDSVRATRHLQCTAHGVTKVEVQISSDCTVPLLQKYGQWHTAQSCLGDMGRNLASHLYGHEMVEIVRRKQHHPVTLVQQRQHHVHKRLVGSSRHHDPVLHWKFLYRAQAT